MMQTSFPGVVISDSGLFRPADVITNDELVTAFNAYGRPPKRAARGRDRAAGTHQALTHFQRRVHRKPRAYVSASCWRSPACSTQRACIRALSPGDDQLSLMAEIAVDAARQALADAGVSGEQVDAVICASANMQRAYPAMAIEIQQALGARGFGFDMNVACSSATFAIEQATNALRCGTARCVVVVNPEITSAHLEWRDRDCHFIFGDVCTALVLQRSDEVPSGQWEVLGTQLVTQFSNNIRNNFGFMNRAEDRDPKDRDLTFRQEGRKVFKEVVPMAAGPHRGAPRARWAGAAQVRRFWLHQANQGMNQLVIKSWSGPMPAARWRR